MDEARGNYKLRGDALEIEDDIIAMAWATLLSSLDLLIWSRCMAMNDRTSNCLVSRILGKTKVRVEVVESGISGHSIPAPGVIKIGHDVLFRHVVMAEYGSVLDEQCAVVTLASSIAHELMHTCGYDSSPEHDDSSTRFCDPIYAAENHFLFALFQRWLLASASRCCNGKLFGGLDLSAPAVACDMSTAMNPSWTEGLPPCSQPFTSFSDIFWFG